MLHRLALAAALTLAAVASAERPRVAVVKSASLAPYAQVVAGFSAEARVTVDEVTLEEGADPEPMLKKVGESRPALVLAIGPAAATAARKYLSRVPQIFVMVPYFQKYDLEGQNTTGIALTSDLSSELHALKELVPRAKRVGVLADPRYSKAFVDEASAQAQARGLSLVPLEVDGATRIDKALSAAKGRVDALVIISDKTVANATIVERLLEFAQDERVPVVGLAPAQVKQGALLALVAAPLSIGQQAGRLANRIVFEKIDPSTVAVAAPEVVELYVNLERAKKLGLGEHFAQALLELAQRQGLPVKPVGESQPVR